VTCKEEAYVTILGRLLGPDDFPYRGEYLVIDQYPCNTENKERKYDEV
jgi:hypothetical protein